MSKEIYISTTPHETRLAIVEDEQLAEIYYERENEYTLAGSIYNGKVTRVLPGMQSSFVDIGLERDAFLYVTDFMEEAGDSADFESADGGHRKQQAAPREQGEAGSREGSQQREGGQREGGRERGGRGRRDRNDRDRGGDRSERRPAAEATPPETESTVSFDEPIAPAPSEAVGSVDQTGEGGSRRWRGRRGRRRGRGAREDRPQTVASETGTAPDVTLEGGYDEEENIVSGIDAESNIEIDLSALPAIPAGREDRGKRGRNRRGGRDRGERGGDRGDRPSVRETARPDDAPLYDNSYAGYDAPEDFSEPTGEPIILPGESLRKYRDPAEVAAEEEEARRNAPVAREVLTVSVPSIEIVGWDGGAVLPGETIRPRGNSGGSNSGSERPAREDRGRGDRGGRDDRGGRSDRGGRNDRGLREDRPRAEAQIYVAPPAVEPTPATPLVTDEEINSEATADLGALPGDVIAAEAPAAEFAGAPAESTRTSSESVTGDASAVELGLEPEAAVKQEPTPEPTEFEPTEGASASISDAAARRDLRFFGREILGSKAEEPAVEPEISVEAEAAIEAALPDQTIEAAPEAEQEAAEPDATIYDLNAAAEPAGESDFTTLQASGEMLSIDTVNTVEEQGFPPIASQDETEPANPVANEGAVQSVTLAEAETTPQPVFEADELTENGGAEIHAYGDGDFEEEEIDGDEYEYDASATGADDAESEEYEEETLEGTADLGSMLHEMTLDSQTGVDEEDEDDSEESDASGGFTEADFGGAEEDEDAPASESTNSNGDGRPGRAERNRRGGNNNAGGGRDRRGGRNSGGDRGRGRGRQSMQTTDLPAINELLKPGQEILVQIAKEPIAKKGARITSHIALPGRFLVFMPTVNHTGVSRKISSDEERRRLKSILLSEKGDAQGGFIVRTAADGASEEELRNDLRFLIHLWNDIKMRSESSKSPALIYHDLSLIERILRDQVTDNFSAIWVDTEAEYERVLRFLQRFQPSLVRRVKLYTKETPLFEHFGVTAEIDKALKAKVWLKSGGSIVINQTEALVAIDINTGKYVGKTARLEDTILKTNLDSIPEIVRQIRLRDLGGIIVIDFIDMDERKNRAKVMQALEDAMRTDRAPSKILPFNDFGLVIMTRKRVKQSLERTLCMPDPVTEGTGMIKSPITIANEIYVEMKKMHRHFEKGDVMLRVHPEVVKTLKANGGKRLQELEEMTRKTILVKSDPSLSPEAFDIH
ncbi:Rne/Rng family ribonuclease [Terriglobus roseus]|uniref:Ribonuclease G n=1 Tax=Terriglobus roseus TaxID=392734 RepID=A0A1H4KCB5_9BACT|nr:Rne/Rng family ribonuclease [Terriglobus roseus]SEB56190.1 ribonuclease G [Terriglobus roseus]